MILTAEEFRAMGFSWDNEAELDCALKRAETVISALTDGKSEAAIAAGGRAALLVKQAAAFQTFDILKAESAANCGSEKHEQRVAIGDYSYSSSDSSGSEEKKAGFDGAITIIRLLSAAGCLYGGAEVTA